MPRFTAPTLFAALSGIAAHSSLCLGGIGSSSSRCSVRRPLPPPRCSLCAHLPMPSPMSLHHLAAHRASTHPCPPPLLPAALPRFVSGWDELCIQQLQQAEAATPSGKCCRHLPPPAAAACRLPPPACAAAALRSARPAACRRPLCAHKCLCGSGLHAASHRGALTPHSQTCAGKVVLSTYPPGYEGEGPAADVDPGMNPTMMCAREFGPEGLLRLHARPFRPAAAVTARAAAAAAALATGAAPSAAPTAAGADAAAAAPPLPSCFWAAGFSFSRASLLFEAPYCPHLPHLFFGEELYQLARMWTRGWDVWVPGVIITVHQWARSARGKGQQGRQGEEQRQGQGARGSSYQADGLVDAAARKASQQRVLCMLRGIASDGADAAPCSAAAGSAAVAAGSPLPDEAAWAVGGVWGLGTVRSLQALWEACGVDFGARVVSEHAQRGGLPAEAFLT